jgi:hypothetical protein
LWQQIRVPKKEFDGLLEWAQRTELIKSTKGDPEMGEPGKVYTLNRKKKERWHRG